MILRWLLALIWMGVIFAISSQTTLPSTGAGGSPIDWYIKKAGHVVVYAILGVLLLRAVTPPGHPPAGRRLVLAIALAAAYAISDEIHQGFVPRRGAHPGDVLIDVLAAAGAAWLWTLLAPRRPCRRPRSAVPAWIPGRPDPPPRGG